MKTRTTIPCSRAELRPIRCQRLRQWTWLLLAALGTLLAGAEGALAQTAPNCLTVICPPDVVTNFTCSGVYVPTSYPIIISNSCPNSPYAVVCNPPVGTPLGVGAHPINCVISAGGVVSAFCHFTIVVETDDQPPVINCPSNIVETACPSPTGGCAAVVNYPAPSAFDNSGIVTVTCVPPSGSVFPCGTTTVNCQAVDRCQLTDHCSFTVTVTPSGNTPVILCPANMLITTCSNTATVSYSAVATPSASFVSCTPPSGSAFPFGVTTVTCLASNDCGTDTCSFTVTVVGVAPASIQCPANVIVSLPCGSNCVPVSYSLPLVSNGGLVACTPAPGTCLPTGVFPVTCVATNLCRQPTSCTFEIRVTQGQGQSPTIVCPSNIVATVDCGVTCLPVTYPAPVVGNGVLVSCNPPSGFCFPPGVSTVTCVASNACASTACSFVVRVVPGQGQGPSILCPSNIVVDTCRPNCDVVNYPAPSVVNGALVNCFPPSGSCFPLGVSAVTCTAANSCATNACTFTVTVRKVPPPSIQCPTAPVIMNAPCLSNCVPIAYALPGVGNGTLINCSPAPGTCLPVGVYSITCRATNICGVTNVCSFPLEVRPAVGQNPPVIQCPTLPLILRVPCDTNCIPLTYTPPPVSNGVLIGCNPPPGTCLPLGNYTVTCRASNLCNTVECSFAVNVLPLNNQPPSISCPTNNINVTAPCGSNCVNVSYALPAVSNGLLVGCVPPPNFCFPLGVTTVTCRATNDCKLVANCSFVVVVSQGQGELPVITCPTNPPVLRVPCTTNCVPLTYPLPVVANGTLVSCSPAPGICLPVGLVNVVCFASNVCGTAVCEFPVSIEPDLGLLHIDCPTNRIVTLPCGSNCVPVTYTPPTVPVGASVSCTPPSGTCLPLGIYVVSCTATNECGSLSKCEFQVRVVPGQGEPPSINCPSNIVVTAPCGATCLPVSYPPPTVTGGVLTGCSFPPGFCFPLGSTTVFCRATNLCGADTCSFVVTVLPSTTGQGPGIQCPSNVVLQLPCGTNCAPIAYPPPVVTGGTLVSCTPAPGTCLPAGLYNVVCVATNGCGDAVCEFPLRIVNSQGTLPALKCPTNLVVRTCDTACEIVNYPPPFVGSGALVGCTPPSGTCFPLGFTTVTCVATNACGTNACSFVVNVRPEPYPQLICPSNIVVTSCSNGAVVTYSLPTVTGSSNHFGVYCSPPSGSFFPVGSHVVSCCVTDVCDRVSCCEFTVTVRPSDPCVKPPLNMVLWLPFDEAVGPIANNIIAGTPDGLHVNGPVPVLGQYVLNSLRFDGSNDLVRVPAYGAISLPNNNFTIDAWVRRETPDQGRRVIVSKIHRVQIATGAIVIRGYEYYLNNGLMNLRLEGTVAQNFNSGIMVPADGAWHHVAVTVTRPGGGAVRFYLDGALVSTQPGPITSPLGNSGHLQVGAGTFPVPNSFFRGGIDEVEIFNRALAPAEIFALWNARQAGKCKITCAAPWDIPVQAGACVTVQARLCNNSGVPQTVNWAATGAPVLTPQGGSVVVQPFSCTNVPVTLCATSGTPQNVNLPWTLAVGADLQCPQICMGSVVVHGVAISLPSDPILVAGTSQAAILRVGLNGLPPGVPVRIRSIGPDMEPDLITVSLNGLPPGEPWILAGISNDVAKAGGEGLNIPVQFTEADPVGLYSIIVEADTDGDGEWEPLASYLAENSVVSPPVLRIEDGKLWWNDEGDGLGTLEAADSLDGPWTPVPGGPGTPVGGAGPMKFYRVAIPEAP